MTSFKLVRFEGSIDSPDQVSVYVVRRNRVLQVFRYKTWDAAAEDTRHTEDEPHVNVDSPGRHSIGDFVPSPKFVLQPA